MLSKSTVVSVQSKKSVHTVKTLMTRDASRDGELHHWRHPREACAQGRVEMVQDTASKGLFCLERLCVRTSRQALSVLQTLGQATFLEASLTSRASPSVSLSPTPHLSDTPLAG